MDQTRACSKSSFRLLKPTCDTRVIHFNYTLGGVLVVCGECYNLE